MNKAQKIAQLEKEIQKLKAGLRGKQAASRRHVDAVREHIVGHEGVLVIHVPRASKQVVVT